MQKQSLKSVLLAVCEWTLVRLGRAPSCEWVCERLSAYYDWDLSLAELRVVESHKYRCADCAREWDETRRVREWFDRATISEDEARDRERRVDDIMATIRDYEAEQAVCQPVPVPMWRRRWVRGLAAACLLVVAMPALAWIGQRAVRAVWDDKRPGGGASVVDVTTARDGLPQRAMADSVAAVVDGHTADRDEADSLDVASHLAIPDATPFGEDILEYIDEEIVRLDARLRVDEMLPRGDKQLERWARREYPHILWLYDVLKQDHGYEGTWQDLVVGSGDIFRFDWPDELGEANCKPRIEAVQAAACVAGFRVRATSDTGVLVPELEWAGKAPEKVVVALASSKAAQERRMTLAMEEIPDGYIHTLQQRSRRVTSILVHFTVTSRIVAEYEEFERIRFFRDFSQAAWGLLEELTNHNDDIRPKCPVDLGRLGQVFQTREWMLEELNKSRAMIEE